MAKKKKEEVPREIKLVDFIGRSILDMGYPEENEARLRLSFDNGYFIDITGNFMISKGRNDDS